MDEIKVPVALERDTIVECIVEIRFRPANESAEELIPGLAFGRLKDIFARTTRQPVAELPRALRDADPNLQYQPTHRLEGEGVSLLLGARIAAVAFRKPYPGWEKVFPLVLRSLNGIAETGLIRSVERVSIKYVNILTEGRDPLDLSQVAVDIRFGKFDLKGTGIVIRGEIERDGCLSVVEISPGAKVVLQGDRGIETLNGLLLNVDTIISGPFNDFQNELSGLLTTIHDAEKKIFFGLLTEPTLNRLGPRWQQ